MGFKALGALSGSGFGALGLWGLSKVCGSRAAAFGIGVGSSDESWAYLSWNPSLGPKVFSTYRGLFRIPKLPNTHYDSPKF